jgi:hypothetical protein
VAGSAATIALVAPASDDVQLRDLVQFDLGQATMSVMLAAADLASVAPTRALATRNSRDACWASPGTGSAPC